MVNAQELRGCIVAAGLHQKDVARAVGISEHAMSRKLKSGNFNLNEAYKIIEVLRMTEPEKIIGIFFAKPK